MLKRGEFVERGQIIAEPNGLGGAKIHTSVSGKVFKITDKEILIEASEKQNKDFVKIKKCNSIVDMVYEAGIVGSGGAGFPTHVKLKANIPEGYIIANCAECEPTLHHNIYLAENNPELIIKGIKYAMKATNAKKAYIGIKGKRKKAIETFREHLKSEQNIEIKEVIDIYPSGEERALIHSIFGEWLSPTQIPIEANCVVLNVETLANITRAVEDGKPVIDKDITLMGKLKKGIGPHVFLQEPIGKSMKHMIEICGGIDGKYGEIIVGGPHTGLPEDIETSVITKTSGGATVTIELPEYKGSVGS